MAGVRWVAIWTALALLALPSLSLADHHEASEEVVAQDCGEVGEHPCGAAAACDCEKAGHDCARGAEHKCADADTCTCGKHAEHDCAKHAEHACGKAADQRCSKAVEKPEAPWGEGI
jgi:hypothetical protein